MQLMDEMRSDSTSNDPELPLVPDVSPNEALPVTCDAHSALACLLLNVQLWSQKSATSDSDAGMVQHSEMWFDDGTIIIQAEDTQFRVYKGTLCRVSSVLREQVESMEALKDKNKCPILRLVDSATDVAHVLRAIFDRWSYPDTDPLPFDVIAAFLRLGHKYRIEPLYENALARLSVAFPSSLSCYIADMRVNRIVFADPQNLQRGEIVIPTILLARELALPSLLPAAFWFASTHLECLAHPRAHALSDADRHLILSAAKPLRAAHAEYLFNWLDEDAVPSPECTTPDVCCAQKLKSALGLWKPPGLSLLLRWRPGAAHGLCPSCVAVGKKHHEEGTRRLWRELPAFFGLPAWDEMEVGSKKDEDIETVQ